MLLHRLARQFGPLLALLLSTSICVRAADSPAAPPIAHFFANPVLGSAKLSPSARYLAAISGAPGRRDYLVVVDLESKNAKLVAGYSDIDIQAFEWVNDNRLVFNMIDRQAGFGDQDAAGLFAVDRDGANLRQLADRRGERFIGTAGTRIKSKLLPWHTFMLNQPGAQDSDFVYVKSYEFDENLRQLQAVDLLKLNTVTGSVQSVERPARVTGWMLDHKGEPRLSWRSDKGTTTLYYRDPASAQWRILASHGTYMGRPGEYTPVGFGSDGRLYAAAYNGKDTSALYTVDLASGKLGAEPVYAAPGYDFDGELIGNREKTLGVRVRAETPGVAWFDPAMAAAQRKLDAALPDTINLISFPSGANPERALVRAYSDVKPVAYYLVNLKTAELSRVGVAYPAIDPQRMGRQELVRYKARDGLDIPALLTRPANGAKAAPLVVLVHGGPYVRGTRWGWNAETQFLASRGYAVLEPEFRGSTGYGQRHFHAGLKQWGLAMQDDIADGARWAVAQGIADGKRICIAGASYGGYATLMGLVNDPDLYKCGVSWAGVTDINLMYDGHWSFASDLSDQWKQYGMPELIGDQAKDAAQLKATSPLVQAARIKAPLLLAYGGIDQRVPMYHGRKLLDAIKPHNRQVEWIEYPEEAHGWRLPENRIDFWSKVEKFLDRNIGSGAQAKLE